MKVLHVPYTFYPDPAGGTEVYVEALAQAQRASGVESIVAAPAQREARYEHAGLPVWRFAVADAVRDVRELYGEGNVEAGAAFGRVLEITRPDLVHMHAFTRAASLHALRAAKQREIPVVFSYHTPTVSCQRGTLLRWGSEVCDGALDVRRCAQCSLHAAGLNRLGSRVLGSLPAGAGELAGSMGLTGGVWTALRMTEFMELRHAAFRSLMAEADHIVALCEWVQRVLLINGVPSAKITVSRQGLPQEAVNDRAIPEQPRGKSSPLRIIFLGRLDPTKGIHVLLDAMRIAPELNARLDIYGVLQGTGGVRYLERLKTLMGQDGRISFNAPVSARDVVSTIRKYDVLAVPSQWLETGPMVVMEAFAAGVPVIGSNLGGIAELVRQQVDGLLVKSDSVSEWTAALQRLADEPSFLARLRGGVRAPRLITEAAREISDLYRKFVPARACA